MSKAVAELKKQVEARQRELTKLHNLVNRIAVLQKELTTLESALAILEPKNTHAPIIEATRHHSKLIKTMSGGPAMSTPQSVRAVLKEAGKPLSLRGIHPLILAKGKQVSYGTMTSAIYDSIKRGKEFKKFGAGTIGLLEWPENM
jgi:hypothetical protein